MQVESPKIGVHKLDQGNAYSLTDAKWLEWTETETREAQKPHADNRHREG